MTVLIVDATNILMRGIKAAERSMRLSVTIHDQEINTGPTYLFINQLAKYIRKVQPERLALCWDGGYSNFRLKVYPEYKASHGGKDVDVEEKENISFVLAKEFLSLAGIHHTYQAGVEGDDLVACYWQVHHAFDEVMILSGDKDFLQLVEESPHGGRTTQIRPGVTPEVWGAETVLEKMGCKTDRVAHVMALTGDKADDIPGIPGFGNKTAVKYLTKYDWNIYALMESGDSKIAGHEDEIIRNFHLVNLRRLDADNNGIFAAPVFAPTAPSSIMWQSLVSWCDRYGMESVKQRLQDGELWET